MSCLCCMACSKNKWLVPLVKHIKVFKNWPQGSALSVAGGIIIPWLSQSTPSGHYSRAATDPLADRSWAPLSGTLSGAERSSLALDLRDPTCSRRWHQCDITLWGPAQTWKPPIWDRFLLAGMCWQGKNKPISNIIADFFHLLFIWCINSL